MIIEFGSQVVYDKNSLKTRVRSYDDKIDTDLIDKKYPNKVFFVCVSTIVIDSVCQMSKVHYPQVYLEVCKYTGKQMKTTRHITEAIIFFSSSFSSSNDDDSEDHNSE